MSRLVFLLFLLFFSSFSVRSQTVLQSTLSIKEIGITGEERLLYGTFYFISGYEILIYDLSFPQKAMVVFSADKVEFYESDSLTHTETAFRFEETFWYSILMDKPFEEKLKAYGWSITDAQYLPDNQKLIFLQDPHKPLSLGLKYQGEQLVSIIRLQEGEKVEHIQFENYTTFANILLPTQIFKETQLGKKDKQVKQWISLKKPMLTQPDERLKVILSLL